MALRVRQQHPEQRKNYKSYKRFLRLEFDFACAYCDLSERDRGGSCNFGCDHYRPRILFPELAADYNNLLYSCSRCNAFKQDFWPSGKFAAIYYVLNPFVHDVVKHIDKSSPKWQPKTYTGYWNISKLRLASDGKIEKRESRAKVESLLAESKDKLAEALKLQDQATERGAQEIMVQLKVRVEQLRGEIVFWAQQLTPELDND
jgi:hypothetical protein